MSQMALMVLAVLVVSEFGGATRQGFFPLRVAFRSATSLSLQNRGGCALGGGLSLYRTGGR